MSYGLGRFYEERVINYIIVIIFVYLLVLVGKNLLLKNLFILYVGYRELILDCLKSLFFDRLFMWFERGGK